MLLDFAIRIIFTSACILKLFYLLTALDSWLSSNLASMSRVDVNMHHMHYLHPVVTPSLHSTFAARATMEDVMNEHVTIGTKIVGAVGALVPT